MASLAITSLDSRPKNFCDKIGASLLVIFYSPISWGNAGINCISSAIFMQTARDSDLFGLAERWYCQQHPINPALFNDPGNVHGRENRQTAQLQPLKRAVVVHIGYRIDFPIGPLG